MLRFRTAALKDKQWVDSAVMAENSRGADYNFGNMYCWQKVYRPVITNFGGRTITKLRYKGKPAFVYPVGAGELRPAVEAIRAYAEEKGYPLVLRALTEEHVQLLEKEYPGCFSFEENTESADYLYDIDALSTYSGKALHGKKNHCNRFEAEHTWQFLPLTRELIPLCAEMLEKWIGDNANRLEKSVSREREAIGRAFDAFEELKLEGGVLMADGQVMGFTMGEMISEDTFDTHFEKAEAGVNGAYPMVCRELARMVKRNHPEARYINREDDMGLEALRRSKQSYKPAFMVRKFTGRWIYD